MKPTDLRLNNIITDENDFEMYVVGIYEDYIIADFKGNEGDVWEFDFRHSFPKPIELTEEILLKCGFENNLDIYFFDEIEGYIKLPFKGSEYFLFKSYGGDAVCKLKYIHQLQNLYHTIIGNELNVKL